MTPMLTPLRSIARLTLRTRRRLASILGRPGPLPMRLAAAERELARIEPALAEEIRDGQLLAWLRSARRTTLELPTPPRQPPVGDLLTGGDFDGGVRYPQILKAAEWVQTRIPFSALEWRSLDQSARQVGFTAARTLTTEAAATIQRAVSDAVLQGLTLRQFRSAVREVAEESVLSPGQVENVYRTQVGRAQAAGQIAVIAHPLVRGEFPYLMYSATHDDRTEETHLAMERLGLNGTAIYRTDDPIWNVFYPPWRWACRCVVIPTSVEDAARYGVREARQWLRSGRPPAAPEYVKPPPFSPPPGWIPTSARLIAV